MAIAGNFSIGNKSYSSGSGNKGPKRRGGKASAKRQASANRARRRASQRRADQNRGIAAARTSGARRRSEPQYLTGRDAAARRASQGTTQRDLQQSIGSLDRRVENALKQGNTALAKDLRSRQNKFVKDLATKRAQESMLSSAPLSQRDKIKKRIKANPNVIVGQDAFDVFQETIDQDFIDPTRKLQNEFPDQFREMYPFTSAIQGGLPAVRLAKQAFGIDDKPIPYNLPDMPGVRYPLDPIAVRTRSDRQAPLDERPFTVSDRQPGLDVDMQPLPLISVEFGDDRPLPDQFPAIDPEQRSEVMQEGYGDILDDVQNFQELDKEFQAESTLGDDLQDRLAAEMQMNKTAEILGGSGYNLNQNVINDLFGQGLLQEGTNYFPNPRITTSPLVDQALASYYQSLQQ